MDNGLQQVYYEAKAKRLREQADVNRHGVHNDGYDDAHYDYILSGHGEEIFAERYILKHRIGKVSSTTIHHHHHHHFLILVIN